MNTIRCSGWRLRKELNTSSSLPPDPMMTHMPPAEEYPTRQGKRSRKPQRVKQDYAPLARELGFRTPGTHTTLTDTAIMWSTQRRSLESASLNVALSLRASRNRINNGKRNPIGSRLRPASFINLLPRLSRRATSIETQRIWRNPPTPIPHLIQTPASNKRYAGPNPGRNHLARNAQWINT